MSSVSKRQKLELTWIGKENRPNLEPRILLEEPEKSYHAKHRVADKDIFDNRLIFGDSLLALKALEAEFAGGKPWRYALIPHDAIAENMTLKGLVALFQAK